MPSILLLYSIAGGSLHTDNGFFFNPKTGGIFMILDLISRTNRSGYHL